MNTINTFFRSYGMQSRLKAVAEFSLSFLATMVAFNELRMFGTMHVVLPVLTILAATNLMMRWRSINVDFNDSERSLSNRFLPMDSHDLLLNSDVHSRIFYNAAVGIALVNREGKPLVTNTFLQEMLGYSGPELAEMHFGDFTHADDIENDLKLYVQLMGGQRSSYDIEKRYIKKDGSQIWVHLTVSLTGEPNDPDTHAIGIVEDISDRKELEENLVEKQLRLEQSERNMELFVRHTPAAVAMFDNDMKYIHASDRWLLDYDLKGEDIIGKSHYEVFPEIDEDHRWRQDHKQVLAGEIIKIDRDSFLREDGEMEWLRYELHPWKGPDGIIGGLIMFTEVITDQVNLQNTIEAHKERLSQIFDNVNDIIGLHSVDGTYVQVSPAISRITGFTPEEMIGRSPFEFWHPEDNQARLDSTTGNLFENSDQVREIDYRHQHKDGHYVWVQTRVRSVNVGDGEVMQHTSSTRDVSEWYRVKKNLDDYMEALERSNEELKTFAYVASHDLQEPLRVITSYLQLLQRRYSSALDEKGTEYISKTVEASARMKALINGLLALSKIEATEMTLSRLEPGKVISELLNDVQLMIKEANAEINYGDMPAIQADYDQVRQLFQNLISNGIKFQLPDNTPQIDISAIQKGKFIEFTVKDNGIGIDQEYQKRIFTIFQRLHSRKDYSGNGIGLAICKKIIERHGGQIWLKSQAEEGAAFHFTLPLSN